jgi:hypothetical protein
MRHHGQIREDRRGLGALVGLLLGVIGGSLLLAALRPEGTPAGTALARPFLEARKLGLDRPAAACPPEISAPRS